jgi:hypothetical protein
MDVDMDLDNDAWDVAGDTCRACWMRRRNEPSNHHGLQGKPAGVLVAPPNGARDVDTRVKPRIAWRGDAQPPAVFSVSLKYQRQGGDFDPVRTRLERLGEKEWQLVPTFPLSSGTLHAVVVTAPNERVESWFITEGDPVHFRSAPPAESAAEADDGAAFEHTVHYRPLPK